ALLAAGGRPPERMRPEEQAPRPSAAAPQASQAPPVAPEGPADGARPAGKASAPSSASGQADASAPAKAGGPANTYGGGAGAGAADPLFEEIRERWPAFLEFLRTSRHVQQEAFLREGTPGRFEDGELTVFFSPN